ncbi:hypothetical protein EDB85DRAFT_143935 [Lactarius pseudohatsudake]|nr:hypothetical protein EDB85DRAFT_143935 [Lactarius pseudohatsudake]
MPALIPVHNTLGALFIGTVLSSILYGVTWLQVYSYYNSHCSRDRWPLKSFVSATRAMFHARELNGSLYTIVTSSSTRLVDSANLVFVTWTTYQFGVTNFGDYQSNAFVSWSQPATALSAIVLEVSVQHFYAYRIYRLGKVCRCTDNVRFWDCIQYTSHIHEPGSSFQGFSIAIFSCKVLCDVLITFGMVYYLLSNRTQVRRTNSVLNLLAIYAINCGTLNFPYMRRPSSSRFDSLSAHSCPF